MQKQITAIALRTVRHNDRHSILVAWTAQCGRVSLLLSEAKTPESRRRRALAMPLTVFEAQIPARPGRDIVTPRDMRALYIAHNTATQPVRATVAMFVAEVLARMLGASAEADPAMFAFLNAFARDLDTLPAAAVINLPVWFLHRMAVLTGVGPDTGTWHRGYGFDLEGARFANAAVYTGDRQNYIEASEARLVRIFECIDAASLARLRLPRHVRRQALDTALRYLSLHHTNLLNLQTLGVLRAL